MMSIAKTPLAYLRAIATQSVTSSTSPVSGFLSRKAVRNVTGTSIMKTSRKLDWQLEVFSNAILSGITIIFHTKRNMIKISHAKRKLENGWKIRKGRGVFMISDEA
eukprot:760556-Hanusia_phi.AAC.2